MNSQGQAEVSRTQQQLQGMTPRRERQTSGNMSLSEFGAEWDIHVMLAATIADLL